MRESRLQQKCLDWLQENYPDILAANIHGSGWSNKGFPDVLCCINGLFVAFELKVGLNEMDAAQRLWRKRILRAGGTHLAPYTLDEFIENVRSIMHDSV